MKNKQQIIDYLKEHGLYDVLETNFIVYCQTDLPSMITRLYKEESTSRLICGYFKWRNSPQGYKFWSEVNHKYLLWL